MTIVNVDDVRAFVAVAESGSVSAASRDLHLTQPAVTRRLQRLEGVLGAVLIERNKRPFGLTDAGHVALERCRRFLALAEDLKGLGHATMPTRELRVGIAHALTELAVIEPVDEMRRAFPSAILRLFTGWSQDLLARVKSGALDAAIILLPDREGFPSGTTAHTVARDDLVIVAPPSWSRRSYTVRHLKDEVWILNPEGCAARAQLQRQLARGKIPLRVAVETYNYELQLRLIARGRGIGLVPHRLLMRSPTRTKVRTLQVRELAFPQLICLVTGDVTPGMDDAIAALRQALAAHLSGSAVR